MRCEIKNKKEIDNSEYIPADDKDLFLKMLGEYSSENERNFFAKMAWKEENECVASVDVILDENFNDDELYILRQGIGEYKAGRGKKGSRRPIAVCGWCLSVFLRQDLFPLLDKHITVLEWLRETDYKGINYKGNQD